MATSLHGEDILQAFKVDAFGDPVNDKDKEKVTLNPTMERAITHGVGEILTHLHDIAKLQRTELVRALISAEDIRKMVQLVTEAIEGQGLHTLPGGVGKSISEGRDVVLSKLTELLQKAGQA